mmetsp:Transcript_72600/g.218046  ORF Transcript_72600/g.218046 Transcript_72600/m.218046 type:complete len:217 (+) Transcript_72600:183-833(+)
MSACRTALNIKAYGERWKRPWAARTIHKSAICNATECVRCFKLHSMREQVLSLSGSRHRDAQAQRAASRAAPRGSGNLGCAARACTCASRAACPLRHLCRASAGSCCRPARRAAARRGRSSTAAAAAGAPRQSGPRRAAAPPASAAPRSRQSPTRAPPPPTPTASRSTRSSPARSAPLCRATSGPPRPLTRPRAAPAGPRASGSRLASRRARRVDP